MKKWFSLALAFLMLIAASCGGGSTSTDTTAASGDTTEAPVTTELTDGLEDKNMEGFSFNILHHDDTWLTWAKTQLVADEENGDLINDTIYKRNSYIEDRFNAKINGNFEVFSQIVRKCYAGNHVGAVMTVHDPVSVSVFLSFIPVIDSVPFSVKIISIVTPGNT